MREQELHRFYPDRHGFTIREGMTGWLVEMWSRQPGLETGGRYLLPFGPRWPRGETVLFRVVQDIPLRMVCDLMVEAALEGEGRCLRRPRPVVAMWWPGPETTKAAGL